MTNEDFQQLVGTYQKLVFTVCYQLVQDYQEAQNLTQETFLSAYQHIDRCQVAYLKPWLARIAANKAKDYLKSAYIRRVQLSEDIDVDIGSSKASRGGGPSPDDIFLEKEEIRQVTDLIYQLKEPYLKVSVLYFLQEKSTTEIAEQLNRPVKTVKTQLYRAKNILKDALKKSIQEEGV
ncbi:MAG: sigma-70 family RNA polymerase sigma factor [Peptococcaceae bacterium]|jgi:RNA polymerase sigma factor (sigma-70 family)|nr:sigma-70 family RNA polymerase sigma factor [Peptococcaceae bacterium]